MSWYAVSRMRGVHLFPSLWSRPVPTYAALPRRLPLRAEFRAGPPGVRGRAIARRRRLAVPGTPGLDAHRWNPSAGRHPKVRRAFTAPIFDRAAIPGAHHGLCCHSLAAPAVPVRAECRPACACDRRPAPLAGEGPREFRGRNRRAHPGPCAATAANGPPGYGWTTGRIAAPGWRRTLSWAPSRPGDASGPEDPAARSTNPL